MKIQNKKISKEMPIIEAMMANEKVAEILFNSGFHCVGCGMAQNETLEQGCKAHGMSKRDIDTLVRAINGEIKPKKKVIKTKIKFKRKKRK